MFALLSNRQRGFTLIEIMVVIVIMSIFAGIVVLSVGGADNRRIAALQQRWMGDLGYIRLLSIDQMQPIGIVRTVTNDASTSQWQAVRLSQPVQLATTKPSVIREFDLSGAQNGTKNQSPWEPEPKIQLPLLEYGLQVRIVDLEQRSPDKTPTALMQDANTPRVLWLGNGEAIPVRIEFYQNNQLIGKVIEIDSTGKPTFR